MAVIGAWIGMAVAVPATVAFTTGPAPTPAPPGPQPTAVTQPVAAVAPASAAPEAPRGPLPGPAQNLPPGPSQNVLVNVPQLAPPVLLPDLPTSIPPAVPPAPASLPAPDRDVGAIVVDAAMSRMGAPYAWGAAGPDAFDCSGLVVWAFHQAGLNLPHSSQALAAGGQPVELDQMQPGDVITLFPDASHVGIYVGDGRMINAEFEGVPVIVESLWGAPINNIRRYR